MMFTMRKNSISLFIALWTFLFYIGVSTGAALNPPDGGAQQYDDGQYGQSGIVPYADGNVEGNQGGNFFRYYQNPQPAYVPDVLPGISPLIQGNRPQEYMEIRDVVIPVNDPGVYGGYRNDYSHNTQNRAYPQTIGSDGMSYLDVEALLRNILLRGNGQGYGAVGGRGYGASGGRGYGAGGGRGSGEGGGQDYGAGDGQSYAESASYQYGTDIDGDYMTVACCR